MSVRENDTEEGTPRMIHPGERAPASTMRTRPAVAGVEGGMVEIGL
ncbi:MAG: hypothetical protein VB032_00640 [Burkholderiaceae bacterium]|nr:hypothetical protein [Burkholderiaceae bacterium]